MFFDTMDNSMKPNILYEAKTEYGLLQVTEQSGQRFLRCDGHIESAVYTDSAHADALVFPYMQRFSYAFAARPAIRRTLLLGGGAFSYPRYYLKNYPNCTIDVVEISEDVLKIDEAYFGLNDLKTERMQIIAEDGFSYLKETKETYDLIINDAFLGSHEEGRGTEDLQVIHDHLNKDGIYMVNLASSLKGISSFSYQHLSAELKEKFKYTAVLQCEEERSLYEKQNLLLIGSEETLL